MIVEKIVRLSDGKRAIVLDEQVLRLVGIDPNGRVSVRTDGKTLVVTGLDVAREPSDRKRSTAPVKGFEHADLRDPRETIRLLDELDRLGFEAWQFQRLHHFGGRSSPATHKSYCENLEGRFRTPSNVRVAQRLLVCLRERRAERDWEDAVAIALAEHPLDIESGRT